MWRPPDKGRWGALGLGLLAAWFVLLCGWEPFLAILFAAAAHELGHYLALRLQGAAVTGLRLSPWGAVMDCRRDGLSDGGERRGRGLTAAHGAGFCALVMLRCGGNLFLLPALALFLGECLGRRRSGGRNG